MGFPESLPTYLSLILRDHNASTLDKLCLVEHWRQPNAYSTQRFLSFSLFPSSHWLARPVFTHPHHHHRLWSGPLQCLQHNLQRMDASFDGLKRNPFLRKGVFTWYISGEEPGAVWEGEVRKWLLINHLPREAWQESRSQGEPREEASSQATVYTGCRM